MSAVSPDVSAVESWSAEVAPVVGTGARFGGVASGPNLGVSLGEGLAESVGFVGLDETQQRGADPLGVAGRVETVVPPSVTPERRLAGVGDALGGEFRDRREVGVGGVRCGGVTVDRRGRSVAPERVERVFAALVRLGAGREVDADHGGDADRHAPVRRAVHPAGGGVAGDPVAHQTDARQDQHEQAELPAPGVGLQQHTRTDDGIGMRTRAHRSRARSRRDRVATTRARPRSG